MVQTPMDFFIEELAVLCLDIDSVRKLLKNDNDRIQTFFKLENEVLTPIRQP